MIQDSSYPAGDYLDEHWVQARKSDLGLIVVPGRAEPVVVEWVEYTCPARCHGPEYTAIFWHGSRLLRARERYEQVIIEAGVRYCHRVRHASAEGVCCTELVQALAAGCRLELERIERGAYQGLWRGEVGARSRARRGRVEHRTCRVVFDLDRDNVLLFRRRTLAPRAR